MVQTLEDWKRLSRDELARLYEQKSMSAIAAIYGITHGAVRHKLNVLGLAGGGHTPGPKRWFQPDRDEIAALYERMSMREVAVHYGVGETVIHKRLHELGIEIKSRSERLTGRNRTKAHREALSKALTGRMAGENNPNWRGGSTKKLRVARTRREYREWKAAVLKAADYKCVRCGLEHGAICKCCGHQVLLHAHHVKPFVEHPELRYDVSNGLCLCERCHMVEHHSKSGELLETP